MKRIVALTLALLCALAPAALAEKTLVGTLPKVATITSTSEKDDEYKQTLEINGDVYVTLARYLKTKRMTAESLLQTVYCQCCMSKVDLVGDLYVSDFPAVRAHALLGEGRDDERTLDAVLVHEAEYEFAFVASCPTAKYDDEYAEMVDFWIESLSIFDDGFDAFSLADVDETFGGGPRTVGAFLRLLEPVSYTWTLSDDFSSAWLELAPEEGSVTLLLEPDETPDDVGNHPDFTQEELSCHCAPSSAYWAGELGDMFAPPRGIDVGASREDVLASYGKVKGCLSNGGESGFDEIITYYAKADGGRYMLRYMLYDGVVAEISLTFLEEL